MYSAVIDTPAMPSRTDIVEARRARLREWIRQHYGGSQRAFRDAIGINQGELSALLGSKSFAEVKAGNIEEKTRGTAFPMPSGYLVNPLSEGSETSPIPEIPKAIDDLIGDVLFLRTVLNSVLAAMTRSTPAAAADVEHALAKLPGHEHKYLADALKTIRDARARMASEQLDELRSQAAQGVKKMPKQRRR